MAHQTSTPHTNWRFFSKLAILVAAIGTATVLTVTRPSPRGLIPFGVGQAEVRAAPGSPAALASKVNYDLTTLHVFNETLVKIRDTYVDPSRIDARAMLVAALDTVQRNIPEVLVESDDTKQQVTIQVNDKTQTFPIADVNTTWALASRLKEIFRFIQPNMNHSDDLPQIEYAAVNGMLSTLDPHSSLLDPESARDLDIQTSGKFGGIGIVIAMKNKNLTVVKLIPGDTPAARAGLKAGDHIVRIGQDATLNLTLNDAMSRLRGDPKTHVAVAVERKGTTGETKFDLVRDVIHVSSVSSHLLENNVGYLRIEQFSVSTGDDLDEAMKTLRTQGAKSWVLDLRGNPGGLLDQAVKVADLFVDSGTIVTTVGYGGKQRDEKHAEAAGTDHQPLVVLVSPGSASASEIVAGALKNLDRGLIVGQTTFGKGSVQVLTDFDDGSKLKLTIAQYLTPGDVSIQNVGVSPDIELDRVYVPTTLDVKHNIHLLKLPNHYREADLDAHLVSQNVHEGDKPADTVHYLYLEPKPQDPDPDADAVGPTDDETTSNSPDAQQFNEDYEIQLARDLAANGSSMKRHELLAQSKALVDKAKADQEQKITAALGALGIDWSAGTSAPPKLDVKIATDQPGDKITAGQTIKITGTVTNTGTTPAYRVHGHAESDDWSFDYAELVFGKIDPGQTKTFTSTLEMPKDAEARVDMLNWKMEDGSGTQIAVPPEKVAVAGMARPQFAYSYQLIDDPQNGNGDGLLQKGESAILRVTVKNVGDGTGLSGGAMLSNKSTDGDDIVVNKGRFDWDKFAPGETKTLDFTFDLKKDFSDPEAIVELAVYDTDLREGVDDKLHFPISPAAAGPRAQTGSVKVSKDTDVREGADGSSMIVGSAHKGGVFKLTGKEGAWDRVELEPGRPGFIADADVASASGAPSTNAYTAAWQVTPPQVALTVPSLEITGDRYKLSGTASDESHVEDVYVLVSNRDAKIEGKKIFYSSNRGSKTPTKLDFTASLPVWPGNNLITVVARENNEVRTVRNVYVFRTDGQPAAATAQ